MSKCLSHVNVIVYHRDYSTNDMNAQISERYLGHSDSVEWLRLDAWGIANKNNDIMGYRSLVVLWHNRTKKRENSMIG